MYDVLSRSGAGLERSPREGAWFGVVGVGVAGVVGAWRAQFFHRSTQSQSCTVSCAFLRETHSSCLHCISGISSMLVQ